MGEASAHLGIARNGASLIPRGLYIPYFERLFVLTEKRGGARAAAQLRSTFVNPRVHAPE
jgi:hypothetical protein